MKTKRLLLLLVLTLSSFFFFFDNVKADTSNVTLSEDPLTYITNDFFTIKEYSDNYMTSQSTYKYYFISYENGVYKSTFIYDESTTSSLTLSYSDQHLRIAYYKSTSFKRVKFVNGSVVNDIESSGIPYTDYWCTRVTNCHYTFLDTNIPNLTTNNNTINLTYQDTTYSFVNTFKPVYQLYCDIHPEDSTPLLTNFINVVIDRLTFITSSLHDNYILLSCFTIFTLFFIILLFRRLQ